MLLESGNLQYAVSVLVLEPLLVWIGCGFYRLMLALSRAFFNIKTVMVKTHLHVVQHAIVFWPMLPCLLSNYAPFDKWAFVFFMVLIML
jgi:hypothetical protein